MFKLMLTATWEQAWPECRAVLSSGWRKGSATQTLLLGLCLNLGQKNFRVSYVLYIAQFEP